MRPLARPLLACLALLLPSALVRAEPPTDPEPAESRPCEEEKFGREVGHRVEAHVEGDRVRLTVRRTFLNPSQRYTEWETDLTLPRGGTVHGFALEDEGRWTPGVLLPATEATQRYEALKRPGSAAPRPSARLSAENNHEVRLSLWNLPPRGAVTVRYEVWLRPSFAGGRRFFTYPAPSEGPGPRPELTLAAPSLAADVRVEEKHPEPDERELEASWRDEPTEGVEARWGVVPWDTGSLGFVQLRTGRLSEAPAQARVVFVLDASQSVGAQGIAEQLSLAEHYLQLLPDAQVEAVVFRRTAERLFRRFLPASQWRDALERLSPARLEPGNGSHLDEGLKLAQRVLAEGQGPARVLVFTDGRLRHAFTSVPAAPSTSAPDAAVHLVWLPYAPNPEPAALAGPPVQGSCGLRIDASAHLDALVRPLRLEQVRLEQARGPLVRTLEPLDEEQERQLWLPSPQTPWGPLVLRALRWGCPFSAPLVLDASLSADLGRTAFAWPTSWSTKERAEAPPTESSERFARTGPWVSPAWSFLAVPEGTGPSSVHAREVECSSGGVSGGVIGGTIGCSIGARHLASRPTEALATLTRLLKPALAPCLGTRALPQLQVRVETTLEEIVDVEVVGADSETQASCVREATWALRLPSGFEGGDAGDFTVSPQP